MSSQTDAQAGKGAVENQLMELTKTKVELLDMKVEMLEAEMSRQRRRGTRYAILIPIISAALGVIGGISASYLEFLPAHQEVMKTYLSGLQGKGKYTEQLHAMREIAEVYGNKVAVEIGRRFRTGATIRALEEIKESNGISERVKDKIEQNLKEVERVLVMDSVIPDNVYDPFTQDLAGTNVDDIAEQIRDLPIRMIGRKVESSWSPKDEQKVIDLKPNLIIMHLGSFEGVKEQEDVDAVGKFIAKVSKESPTTHFLVYSRKRKSVIDRVGPLARMKSAALKEVKELKGSEERLKRRISILEIEPPQRFAEEKNSERLQIAVLRILDFDQLYERSWE